MVSTLEWFIIFLREMGIWFIRRLLGWEWYFCCSFIHQSCNSWQGGREELVISSDKEMTHCMTLVHWTAAFNKYLISLSLSLCRTERWIHNNIFLTTIDCNFWLSIIGYINPIKGNYKERYLGFPNDKFPDLEVLWKLNKRYIASKWKR